jgi:hypothetical protein
MMTWFQVHLVRVRSGRRLNYVGPWLIIGVMLAAGCGGDTSAPQAVPTIVHFVPNSHAFWSNSQSWTTSYGPAYGEILLQPSNFVPCRGGPFALCYYSGPNSGSEDLSCKLTTDGKYANCQCFDVPYGVYFVDINAILNYSVYQSTIAQCGADGSACATPNSAPVCQSVNQGTLIPHAAVFSTFSFDCVPTNGIGQTSCSSAPYAGCMTAPCSAPDASGIVQCSCPVFDGPFQIGQNNQACTLGDGLVWSAAYAPPTAASTSPTSAVVPDEASGTTPASAACVPDAPGGLGCPLYVPGTTSLPPNSGVNCQTVCDEYSSCTQEGGIQEGLTCDSTLCTDQCNDLDVVGEACASLAKCDVSEIIKAEQAAQCSCCASQLCGCQANVQTNATIASLVQQQRNLGIKPQCDINDTLCGSP